MHKDINLDWSEQFSLISPVTAVPSAFYRIFLKQVVANPTDRFRMCWEEKGQCILFRSHPPPTVKPTCPCSSHLPCYYHDIHKSITIQPLAAK